MRLHGQNRVQKMKNSINSGKALQSWKKQCSSRIKKLDKLKTIENKLNGIQQKMVEYENKL